MRPLRIDIQQAHYHVMIGTGGIGSGCFFAIDGNQTLGREESRGGCFLDRQDYCKLHIISHYLKALLGPEFTVIPASKVGDDLQGRRLLEEMNTAGLDTSYVEVSPGDVTLFSFCFVYPDGSGGNLTTSNSATVKLDESFIDKLAPEFSRWRNQGIAVAAPEVPLPARLQLLKYGTEYSFFRVAALTSEEARSSLAIPIVEHSDLLALNLEEATALTGMDPGVRTPAEIIEKTLEHLHTIRAKVLLSITGGQQGSWMWDGSLLHHTPIVPVQITSTAGAGDAHLAGVLAGIVADLSLPDANQLGALVAALKITCPHTIHKDIDCPKLAEFALQNSVGLSTSLQRLLDG